MNEDIITQRHALILARDYNLVPVEPLKCERVIGKYTVDSLWFATSDGTMRCFTQYQAKQIEKKLVEGKPCTACWSEGKQWEDEMVPMFVFCTLSGFQDPVEFLNTVFEPGEPIKVGCYPLTQKNAPDCTYEYLDDEVEIIWTPDDVTSTLIVTTKPDDIVRMNAAAGGCFKRFEQDGCHAEINCCPS